MKEKQTLTVSFPVCIANAMIWCFDLNADPYNSNRVGVGASIMEPQDLGTLHLDWTAICPGIGAQLGKALSDNDFFLPGLAS